MKVRELKAMLEGCDDNAEIPWTFQGIPYSGDYYIGLTNVRNQELIEDGGLDKDDLLPPNTIYVAMDM